ncbi:hypothetical protein Tco_1537578 [Tanacetum coccineum]
MAPVRISLGPEPFMMSAQISSGLAPQCLKMLDHSSSSLGLHCQKAFDQISSNLISQMSQRRLLASLQAPILKDKKGNTLTHDAKTGVYSFQEDQHWENSESNVINTVKLGLSMCMKRSNVKEM